MSYEYSITPIDIGDIDVPNYSILDIKASCLDEKCESLEVKKIIMPSGCDITDNNKMEEEFCCGPNFDLSDSVSNYGNCKVSNVSNDEIPLLDLISNADMFQIGYNNANKKYDFQGNRVEVCRLSGLSGDSTTDFYILKNPLDTDTNTAGIEGWIQTSINKIGNSEAILDCGIGTTQPARPISDFDDPTINNSANIVSNSFTVVDAAKNTSIRQRLGANGNTGKFTTTSQYLKFTSIPDVEGGDTTSFTTKVAIPETVGDANNMINTVCGTNSCGHVELVEITHLQSCSLVTDSSNYTVELKDAFDNVCNELNSSEINMKTVGPLFTKNNHVLFELSADEMKVNAKSNTMDVCATGTTNPRIYAQNFTQESFPYDNGEIPNFVSWVRTHSGNSKDAYLKCYEAKVPVARNSETNGFVRKIGFVGDLGLENTIRTDPMLKNVTTFKSLPSDVRRALGVDNSDSWNGRLYSEALAAILKTKT